MNKFKKGVIVFFLTLELFLISGCAQKKHITYYQNIDSISNLNSSNFEPSIQPDDVLMIIVSSPDPEAAAPFNLTSENIPSVVGQSTIAQRQQQLYLVDKDGLVDFPILGKIKFGGFKKQQNIENLKEKLGKYLKDPIVNIRIMNFKVTIQGEVSKPGSYNIVSERVTLPEALSLAGDLTIYGKRDNIILIREIDGKKSINRIDITKADFINSPYYYLSQNDLLYVEPNTAKSNSSTFNQNIPVWISLTSVIISLFLIFKK